MSSNDLIYSPIEDIIAYTMREGGCFYPYEGKLPEDYFAYFLRDGRVYDTALKKILGDPWRYTDPYVILELLRGYVIRDGVSMPMRESELAGIAQAKKDDDMHAELRAENKKFFLTV